MMHSYVLASVVALVACSESAIVSRTPDRQPGDATSMSPALPEQYAVTPPPGGELPPSQTTPGPIPVEFRHVWAIEVADCKRDPGLTRIAIAPGAIKFYEGRAEVTSLEQTAADGVIMQVKHSAEGGTETEVHHLKLNSAGTTLSYDRGGSNFTYTRCD